MDSQYVKLYDISRIRSIHGGPYKTCIDIFFGTDNIYKRIKESNVITKEVIARQYNIPESWVYGIYYLDPAKGVKVTIKRRYPADHIYCSDIRDAQQHVPLGMLEIERSVLE